MKVLKQAIHILINIVFYAVVCLSLLMLIDRWVFQDGSQRIFGYQAVCVLSGSMEDTLSVGDIIIIKEENRYIKGDIISFYEGDDIITHRIIEENEEGYVTKGDANNAADSKTVKTSAVAGKKLAVIPYIGYIKIVLSTPVGLIFAFLICGGWYFRKRYVQERKGTNDEG